MLVHSGGAKGGGVLRPSLASPDRDRAQAGRSRPSEFPQFAAGEVKRHGARIDGEAASVLVQAVGQDLRSLAAAAHQLVSDFPGETIEVASVKKYFGGRAEAKSFAVADAAFYGRRQAALEELRWALDGGTPPVLVTSAFAGGVRGLARYQGAPPRMRRSDPRGRRAPWKLRSLREQSRGLERGRAGQGDPRGRAGRRGHQGCGQRRQLHARATGAHDHRATGASL